VNVSRPKNARSASNYGETAVRILAKKDIILIYGLQTKSGLMVMQESGMQLIMMSKMKSAILVSLIIFGLSLGNSFSQEKTSIKCVVSDIQTTDTLIISYFNALSELDKANIKNINFAFEYFNDIVADKRESLRDTAALIFQYYYLKCSNIYLNENGDPVSYSEISKEEINNINSKQLAKSGMVLSMISEGDKLYIEPLPGFLSNQFRGYVSEDLQEFFLIYDIFLKSVYIRYNTKDIAEYIKLTEELLLRTEAFTRKCKPPLNKDYLNRFYISHLNRYLTISEIFGVQLDQNISNTNLSLKNFYMEFGDQNSEINAGQIILFYTQKLKEKAQNQLYLDDFFYSYDYNEFSIPEIRKDLTIDNVFPELKRYFNVE